MNWIWFWGICPDCVLSGVDWTNVRVTIPSSSLRKFWQEMFKEVGRAFFFTAKLTGFHPCNWVKYTQGPATFRNFRRGDIRVKRRPALLPCPGMTNTSRKIVCLICRCYNYPPILCIVAREFLKACLVRLTLYTQLMKGQIHIEPLSPTPITN